MFKISYFHPALQLLILLAIAFVSIHFVAYDSLASFEDDSESYLIMARYFSPYTPASDLIKDAYRFEHHPPLFAWLLALTDSAYDLRQAHVIVALCFVAACWMFLHWAGRLSGSPGLALGILVLFVCTPATWLRMLGILSENLYLFLSLAALYVDDRYCHKENQRAGAWILLAVLLSALLLTRSVGISMVLGYGITRLLSLKKTGVHLWRQWLPFVLPLILVLLWGWGRETAGEKLYAPYIQGVFNEILAAENPLLQLWLMLKPQFLHFYDAWRGAFIIYWTDDYAVRPLLLSFIGILALTGLGLRLRANKTDSWYVLIYVAIIILWPYAENTTRFLYPLLPFMILYAVYALRTAAEKMPKARYSRHLSVFGLALLYALTVPSLAFIYQRSQHPSRGNTLDYTHTVALYRLPNLARAEERAAWNVILFEDMNKIRRLTRPQEKIMWFTPRFINLFADRQGMPLLSADNAQEFCHKLKHSGAAYLFISRLNPRYTIANGLVLLETAKTCTVPAALSLMPDGTLFSILLKIERI
ncbi:MAG: hypothetical protein GY862_37635 [Gammaproteobacteria bacterium]|nr:hypothetical protein [Gammaproteobacteria bacterium]